MANQTINVVVNSKGVVTVVKELNAMGDAARSTTTYLNGLRSILAAALTFSGAGAILEVADAFTVMQNRLRQVASETNTVSDSWKRLMVIANNSYSTIDATVDLYFRVAQAYKAWGKSAEEAYEFTDLFQKAAILSGSSMQTTAQAVYQFGQALNKGKLDGDEFRSVLEGLPYVATLIQKELGITRAELYAWSADGKISVDRVAEAFKKAAATIRGDWGNVTPTIAMAMNVLRNQWVDFVGKIQTSTGIFTALAYVILGVANNFGLLAIAMTPVAAAMVYMGGRLAVGLVVIMIKDLTIALRAIIPVMWSFNAAALANPYVLLAVAIAAVIAAIVYFRNELGLTNENLMLVWTTATMVFTALYSGFMYVATIIADIVVKLYEWTSVLPTILTGAMVLFKGLVQIFTGIVELVIEVGKYLIDAFIPVFQQMIDIAKQYQGLISDIVDLFLESLQPAIKDLKAAWDILYKAMQPGLTFVKNILKDIWDGWKLLADWLKNTFIKVIKDIFDGWIKILEKVLSWVERIISALRTALSLLGKTKSGASGGGGGGKGAHYGASFKAGEGFATGGRFKVGGTGAGRDTTPVAFRAERGERVTVETKKQQRQADQSGAAANVNVPVSIVNVFDPSMIVDAISSSAGQRAITNVIKANREEVNYSLGAA